MISDNSKIKVNYQCFAKLFLFAFKESNVKNCLSNYYFRIYICKKRNIFFSMND